MKKRPLIFIILFLLIISFPLWGIIIYTNKSTDSENRILNNVKNITGIRTLNGFISNNHAFKREISDLYMKLYIYLFDESPIPSKVMMGKSDWLFLGNSYNNCYNASLGTIYIDQEEIDSICNNINEIKLFCDSIGSSFYFTIAPEKGTIYPEYLRLTPNRTQKLKNIIISNLKERYNIYTIDLSIPVLANKENALLYYKSDSHWNDYGGYLGTKYLIREISKEYELFSYNESNYVIDLIEKKTSEADLAKMLYLDVQENFFIITPPDKIETEVRVIEDKWASISINHILNHSNKNNTTVFVFKDSFFGAMLSPFITSLKEATLFHSFIFNKQKVLEQIETLGYTPDFILFEVVERNLYNIKYQ